MWTEGAISVMGAKPGTVCHYWVKHFEEGSECGIDNGRISKLMIKVGGQVTANYDRGWDIKSKDSATKRALAILLHEYN